MLKQIILCICTIVVITYAIDNIKPINNADVISIPRMLNYQGKLTNLSGNPVSDSIYTISFSLYTTANGGSPIWNETQSVQTSQGLFSVLLGSNDEIEVIPENGNCYLEMQVSPNPAMTPRIRLVSSAYAYLARKADSADYVRNISVNYVDSARVSTNAYKIQGKDTIALSSKFVDEGQANAVSSGMIIDGNVTMAKINQTGATAGQVIKWNGSAWIPSNDSFVAGAYLPLAGGTMTGPISNTGNPSITMGKGNFGANNINTGTQAFVAGSNNMARGNYSVIAGGGSASIADSNQALGEQSTVSGGKRNIASGFTAVVGGGQINTASGDYTVVNGGSNNSVTDAYSTIGGGRLNIVNGSYATVGGGGENIASAADATVGGGYENTAEGINATIAGGESNVASGPYSTVSGGDGNYASGNNATVSGGMGNAAWGFSSIVPGGSSNQALGRFSFASGRRAQANHTGTFVWADSTNTDFTSTNTNQFLIRANGNVGINTNSPSSPLTVAGMIQSTSGGYKFPDGSVQTTAGGSGSGSVTNINQGTGIICSPNPITTTGSVQFDSSYGDNRYVNDGQSNSVTSGMISDNTIQRTDVTTDFKAPYSDTSDYVKNINITYVDSARIAVNAYDAYELQGKDTTALSIKFVDEGQLNSITNSMLDDNAVTSGKIQDGTIQVSDLGFTPVGRPFTPLISGTEIALPCTLEANIGTPPFSDFAPNLQDASSKMKFSNNGAVLNVKNTGSGDAINIIDAGGDGININHSAGAGIMINRADNGVYINRSSGTGIYVDSVGSDGINVSTANNGLFVMKASNIGVYVNRASYDGVFIDSAGSYGVRAGGAEGGVWGNSLDGYGVRARSISGTALKVEGTSEFTGQITSTATDKAAPISVTSTAVCPNLNADLLDGQHASSFMGTSSDYGRSGVATDLYEGTTTLTNKYVNEGQTNAISSAMIIDGSIYGRDVALPCTLIATTTTTAGVVNIRNDGTGEGLRIDSSGGHGIRVSKSTGDGIRISNTGGQGINIANAAAHGVFIQRANQDGINISRAGDNGVYVDSATDVGFFVNRADTGLKVLRAKDIGVYVDTAAKIGFYVNRADTGLKVHRAVYNGVSIDTVSYIGVNVTRAGWNAFNVDSAGWYGLDVYKAGINGVNVSYAGENGFSVSRPGKNGLYVYRVGDNGVHIDSAADVGFYVNRADTGFKINRAKDVGVYIDSAYYGLFIDSVYNNGVIIKKASTGYRIINSYDGVNVDTALNIGVLINKALAGIRINNATLYGIHIDSAGGDAFYATRTGGHGLNITRAGDNGINIDSAADVGFYVNRSDTGLFIKRAVNSGIIVDTVATYGIKINRGLFGLVIERATGGGILVDSGATGVSVNRSGGNAFAVWRSGDNGVHIDSVADVGYYVNKCDTGIRIVKANNYGVFIDTASSSGIYIKKTGFRGIHIDTTGDDGYYVTKTGATGMVIRRANSMGIWVDSAGSTGLAISQANRGIEVHRASDDGIYVDSAYDNGILVQRAGWDGISAVGHVSGGRFGTKKASGVAVRAFAYNSIYNDTAIYANGLGLATGGWATVTKDGEALSIVSQDRTIIAYGTAQLNNGTVDIEYPKMFKNNIRAEIPVSINLTPVGDPSGMLCVSEMKSDGFSVNIKQVPGWAGENDIRLSWTAVGTLKEPETTPEAKAEWDRMMTERGR